MTLHSRLLKNGILAGMGIGMLLLATPEANAMVGHCANCHTMHASQDGVAIGTPTAQLLNSATCTGCHAVTNNDGVFADGPQVNSSNATMLAGGTFVNVAGNHAAGHNVDELDSGQDSNIGPNIGLAPPGYTASTDPASATVDWAGTQLTCAGTNGCHGDRSVAAPMDAINGAHHNNAADAVTTDGTVGGSYRFLQGISGNEDVDWEYSVSNADHNQYKGVDRSGSADTTSTADTISALCAQCHGTFHSGAAGDISVGNDMSSAWVRHPTDFDMGTVRSAGDGSDYDGYGGIGVHTYQTEAPVASADISAQLGTVYQAADDAIVTCISCHRAHGSEYDDSLRWDYAGVEVGGTGTTGSGGCLLCHTTK